MCLKFYREGFDDMKKFLLNVVKLVIGLVSILVYAALGNEVLSSIIGGDLKYEDNILINISTVNLIFIWGLPLGGLVLIVLYFTLKRDSAGTKIVPVYSGMVQLGQIEKVKPSKTYNITFIILILASIVGFVYFVNDYTVIFKDRIEKHSIIKSKNISYKYEEIKEIEIGVWPTRHGILYYKLKLKDGETVNIAANNLSNNNNSLDGMVIVNNVIRDKNIKRIIDRKNFHKIVDGLGEQYERKYEDLFKE